MGNGNCKNCNKCKCDNCDVGDKNLTNNIIDKKLEIIKNDSYESFESEINKDNVEENNENKAVQVSKNIENEKNTTNNNQEIITDNKKDKEKIEIDNNNSINVNEKNDTINNINIIYNDKDKDKDKENKKEEHDENNINNNTNDKKLKSNEKNKINDDQVKKVKKNDILENINQNFVSYKKLDFLDANEEEKKSIEEKHKIIKTRNNIEEFEIINNDLVYISNKNKNIEDNIDIEYNVDSHLKANGDNTIDTKDIKEENKNIFNANKYIKIYNIIPKNKISKLDDNAIVCNSILEKIIKIPSKNKIVYNERFCVLTKKTFSYYKSKESYLNLSKPLLLIDLKNIKKVERTILDDSSYYFGLICNINDDTKMFIDKINTFINIGENNTEEFLLGFRSKNKDLIIKWIVILNYLVENNQINNQ